MPTAFRFSYEDAVKTLIMFHSIPAGAEVEILPYDPNAIAFNAPFYSTTLQDFYNIINGYRNTSQKIPAIKDLRTITGLGLKEAKDVMDDFWNTTNTFQEFTKVLKKHRLPPSP